uniref:C2H2-type domain-containing protein n=1 Tax=Sparus aurata TaxID=8175 RepID=A0A671UGF8_SPAAU
VEGAKEHLDLSRNKEHLDLSRNKEASEKSVNQSLSGGRADVTVKTELESEKTSASRSSLPNNHHDAHSSVRLFKCTQCQRPFKRRNDLKRHYRVHSSVKIMPFTCKVCDKKFSSRTIVKNHMRSHSGERPYACTYCDKRFMTSSVLRSHERIHTGERPYVCSFCNKTFIQSYTYTVHLRVHKKEKPYLFTKKVVIGGNNSTPSQPPFDLHLCSLPPPQQGQSTVILKLHSLLFFNLSLIRSVCIHT